MNALHEQPQLAPLFDSTCRAIFERVARQPLSARMLARDLRLAPAEVRRRLGELSRAGLVASEGSGARVRYRIDPAGMESIHHALEAAWARRVAGSFVMAAGPGAGFPHFAPGFSQFVALRSRGAGEAPKVPFIDNAHPPGARK